MSSLCTFQYPFHALPAASTPRNVVLFYGLSGEPMRPHDETVRAAIEQSLGNTLKAMLTPPQGLFVRKPELWKATLPSLEKWAPTIAEQLSSTGSLQPIATVSSVETKAGTPGGDAATAVVTAVVLEDGTGPSTKTSARSSLNIVVGASRVSSAPLPWISPRRVVPRKKAPHRI